MRIFNRPSLLAKAFVYTLVGAALALLTPIARADQAAGFSVDRLYTSAPGADGWVTDSLNWSPKLGGVFGIFGSYAHNSLIIADGSGGGLTVVRHELLATYGGSITYDLFRFSVQLSNPLWLSGDSGSVGSTTYSAPSVDPGANPDNISTARFGVDVRVWGAADGPFRLGLGAVLMVPSGSGTPSQYITDGDYEAQFRLMAAGNYGLLAYAAHVGVHIRPLSDSATIGSPQGSEFLWGVAVGPRLPIGHCGWTLSLGPEVFSGSAFKALFASRVTSIEWLTTARLAGTLDHGMGLQIKLGYGSGLMSHLGTPESRLLLGLEFVPFENVGAEGTHTP
jgi:hypothetical protein